MKPIRLPEPPSPTNLGVPEIFEGGAYSVVRRAIIIRNGSLGSENQCIGLVRALGLSDKHVLYHLAAARGFEDIVTFLIQGGVDVSRKDDFGSTPLQEAIKNGHDRVASLLLREGASLRIHDAGSFLCNAVSRGDSNFLKRILSNGIDPNSRDYDYRTALHVAASEGLYLMAKLLIEAGANVFLQDSCLQTKSDVPGLENTLVNCLERLFKTRYGTSLIPHYVVGCLLESPDQSTTAARVVIDNNIYPLLLDCLINGNEEVAGAAMDTIKTLVCFKEGVDIVFPANSNEATHLRNLAS